MRTGEVELLSASAEALDDVCGYVGRVNVDLPNMAWLWFVAQHLPDDEKFFPHGKWATLQNIQRQLEYSAVEAAHDASGEKETNK